MLDTFTDEEHLNLEKLKIGNFSNLCVEIKKNEEDLWEEYDSTGTFVKIAIWKENIISLDDNYLEVRTYFLIFYLKKIIVN